MDPTEAFIKLVETLEQLEAEYEDDPKSTETEELRTEAIGQLNALSNWLGPLGGFPPKISDIDFTAERDDDDDE